MLKTIVFWGWSPILITTVAVTGIYYNWEIWQVATLAGFILILGLIMLVISTGEQRMESHSIRLKHLTGYFNRRFMGTSSLSIFAIIDTLFSLDDPQLWDWARACDMSARIFNAWCDSFTERIEEDRRAGRFRIYIRTYLNELWLINSYYYEFIEQFHEIAEKLEISPATREQYNRFVLEYNSFTQNFREHLAELKKQALTEIDPPSVKLAQSLPGTAAPQPQREADLH